MKVIFIGKGIVGYGRYMKYANIIDHPQKETIRHRLKVMSFFDQFGVAATKEAFSVSRSTVFLWKKTLKEANGRIQSLAPESKAPKTPRKKRKVDLKHCQFIIDYRTLHPGVDKVTIKPALDRYCLENKLEFISESTIGRLIKELKEKGLILKTSRVSFYGKTGRLIKREINRRKKSRRKGFLPKMPGDLVQMDTIEIFIQGTRRYFFTALDVVTASGFALEYKSKISANSVDFLQKVIRVFPFAIQRIQTDNGSEFHKHFDDFCQRQDLIHFYNYPHHPQSNSHLERFNRTIQCQYINWHLNELIDPSKFNPGLIEYLLWYNTERPHRRLNKTPPFKYYIDNFIKSNQSKMLWTLTIS